MSEEELNTNYIREKTGLVENDELIPIILEMIKENYKAGLCQSEFDNTMGLIEENQLLKKQLEVGKEQYNDLVEEKEGLQEQLSIKTLQLEEMKLSKRDYTQENILEMKLTLKENQQKEFIKWLESMLDNDRDIFSVVRVKDVLSKYKEIIGVSNEY